MLSDADFFFQSKSTLKMITQILIFIFLGLFLGLKKVYFAYKSNYSYCWTIKMITSFKKCRTFQNLWNSSRKVVLSALGIWYTSKCMQHVMPYLSSKPLSISNRCYTIVSWSSVVEQFASWQDVGKSRHGYKFGILRGPIRRLCTAAKQARLDHVAQIQMDSEKLLSFVPGISSGLSVWPL